MLHEQRVERDPVRSVQDVAETGLGLGRGPRADDPEPVDDPVDVGIDGDRRDAVAEDEHAVRGLRPDPREIGQRLEGRGDLPSVPREERPGAVADDPGLHVVETGRPDQRFDRPGGGAGERRGVGVAREQAGARGIGVRVAGPLGKDRTDEHLERVLGVVSQVRRAPVPGPVEGAQPIEDRLPVGSLGSHRRAAHSASLAATPPATGTWEAATGAGGPSPGSERSGSSDAREPRNSSPTR